MASIVDVLEVEYRAVDNATQVIVKISHANDELAKHI